MKVYDEHQVLKEVICNCCGRQLLVENGMLKDAAYEGRQAFGYFSHKDGMVHRFDLCEKCYDEMVGTFKVPVEESESAELL